jgi:hypothetical protein
LPKVAAELRTGVGKPLKGVTDAIEVWLAAFTVNLVSRDALGLAE